jgi:hypothetical protein
MVSSTDQFWLPVQPLLTFEFVPSLIQKLLVLKAGEFGGIVTLGPRAINRGGMIMAIQIIMDTTGDSRHTFNPQDLQELARAEQRFKDLTGRGFTAAVRTGPGQVSCIKSFDPTAEETLFFPRLVGG